MACCRCKIVRSLVVKVYCSNRVYQFRRGCTDKKLFVVMLVQSPKKICLIMLVLLVRAMKLKMLVRNVHKGNFIKKHRAESIRPFRKPVRRRLNNRVRTAVLNHFIKLFAYNRRFRRSLMHRVRHRLSAERIFNCRDKTAFFACLAQKLPDKRNC